MVDKGWTLTRAAEPRAAERSARTSRFPRWSGVPSVGGPSFADESADDGGSVDQCDKSVDDAGSSLVQMASLLKRRLCQESVRSTTQPAPAWSGDPFIADPPSTATHPVGRGSPNCLAGIEMNRYLLSNPMPNRCSPTHLLQRGPQERRVVTVRRRNHAFDWDTGPVSHQGPLRALLPAVYRGLPAAPAPQGALTMRPSTVTSPSSWPTILS